MTLDAQVRDLAANRIRIELQERQHFFSAQVEAIYGEMNERGVLRSGMTIAAVTEAVRNEAAVRAQLAWQIVARVLFSIQLPLDPALAAALKAFVDEQSRQCSPDLETQLQKAASLMGRPPQAVDALWSPALAKVHSEIDIALAAARTEQEATGSTVINIYQRYGIIQTGPHSTATFTASASERTAITNALDAVHSAVVKGADVAEHERREALELIDDAKAEIAKPTPNGLRLKSALSGIATTVQTMGSAAAAYQLLKGAAAIAGVHLP